MKTNFLRIAFILILSASLAIFLSFVCGDSNPDKMVWRVSSHSQENVEITFDASRSAQIEIVANAEGGECRLSCPNYKRVSFRESNIKANNHMDSYCKFQAEIVAPGVISINFAKMPKANKEYNTYFLIEGEDGEDFNATVVKVTRKLNTMEKHNTATHLANIAL